MGILDSPLWLAAATLIVLFVAGWLGQIAARGRRRLMESERQDFGIVVGATLTLLGLIIGFTFSMAVSRYDLRKSYEEGEASAIETEYLRADLLAESDATNIKGLLRSYVQSRIDFYSAEAGSRVSVIDSQTRQLQDELWRAVRSPAVVSRDPVTALVVAGMNDVMNSQGYTQAAWWNRIPAPAWMLMLTMAVCATFLVGYNVKDPQRERGMLVVLPIVLSISFYLVADIESPRGGFIRVIPQNLMALAQSMRTTDVGRR
jgi:hypothetical protein